MWKRKWLIPVLLLTVVVAGSLTGVALASNGDDSQPTVTAAAPASGWPGETLDVVVSGTDFTGATAVSFSGTGITVNNYTVDNATQITADVSIACNATSGARDVSVTTAAGTGTLSGSFTVETRQQALLDRVCQIYQQNTGVAIDPQQLKDAFTQAQRELQDEALQSRLQKLVDEGRITQEEADQYLTWWQSRPNIELPELGGFGGHGHRGGMMWGGGRCGGPNGTGNW
jgi:hypothetical protein